MSVASRNAFALLGDDDASSAPASAPAAAAPAAAPAQNTRGAARGRGGPAARGGGYYRRGGGNKSAPREGGDAAEEPAAGDEGRRKFNGDGRGDGRGRGRGRGGRDGRGRGRGAAGARLDRHSATGITDSEKKIHQGWGGDEPGTELNAEAGGAADAAQEANDWGVAPDAAPAAAEGAAPAPEAAEGAAPERKREEEEEDNTLTLEQYRQQQTKSDIVPTKLEGRKIDDTEIKGTVIKKASEEEESYFAAKTKAAPKARTEKKEKVFIEIDARFERPQRGGGRGGFDRGRGRGDTRGRGENRGRGGRGGRGGRQNGAAQSGPQIDDQSAFPSLS